MLTLDTTKKFHEPKRAEVLAAEINSDDLDGWAAVVEDYGNGWAAVAIKDENGETVGWM